MVLQAVPATCRLLAEALVNSGLADVWAARDFGFDEYRDGYGGPHPADDLMFELIHEVIARHPGIGKRKLELDRRYDQLFYVLSAERRGDKIDDVKREQLLGLALRGVPSGLFGGVQGFGAGWVSPEATQEISTTLATVTTDELTRNFQPAAMEEAGVYKFWADRVTPQTLPTIFADFAALRAFYVVVAEHGDGVIIARD